MVACDLSGSAAMEDEGMAKANPGLQAWSDLLHRHREPHLVVGWTRNVNRWRDEAFFDLIGRQRPAGRYSVKRDLDEKRGQYLLLAAFGQESDAREFAETIGAETIARYPGYASQRGFKYGSKFGKTLKAAMQRGKLGKRVQVSPGKKSP
jgi:hypothetical protein